MKNTQANQNISGLICDFNRDRKDKKFQNLRYQYQYFTNIFKYQNKIITRWWDLSPTCFVGSVIIVIIAGPSCYVV